jgi:hypothetical protein
MKTASSQRAMVFSPPAVAAAFILMPFRMPAISLTSRAHAGTAFRFDFGSGRTASGYLKILPGSTYGKQAGKR